MVSLEIPGDGLFLCGNSVDMLKTLPDKSVHCCVTSPPYFHARDYETGHWVGGHEDCDHKKAWTGYFWKYQCPTCQALRIDQQIGVELTVDQYLDNLISVFREVKRVLRDDGTCWVNIDDSYIKKSLELVPWRFAIAMKEMGWIIRDIVIWAKPNSVENVRDRPTHAHEYIFMFTKSTTYFCDMVSVMQNKKIDNGGLFSAGYEYSYGNLRDFWLVNPIGVKGVHCAAYPEELVRRCISMSTSDKGSCYACGAPIVRISTVVRDSEREADFSDKWQLRIEKGISSPKSTIDSVNNYAKYSHIGWECSCTCNSTEPAIPCVVIDPFLGSGTTTLVACLMGRKSIGIDLNSSYLRIAEDRVRDRLEASFGLLQL